MKTIIRHLPILLMSLIILTSCADDRADFGRTFLGLAGIVVGTLIGALFYNRGEKPLLGIIIGIFSVGILVGLSVSIPQEIANAIGWIVSVLGTILLYIVLIKNAKEK